MDKERKGRRGYCTHKRLSERYFRRPGPYFGSPQINRTGGVEKCTGNEGRNKREKDIYICLLFSSFHQGRARFAFGRVEKGERKKVNWRGFLARNESMRLKFITGESDNAPAE